VNYAAGNGFTEAFPGNKKSDTHHMSLYLSTIEGVDIYGQLPEQQLSNKQGCIPINEEVFFNLLKYSMSKQAREDRCNQVFIGFDRESLSLQPLSSLLENPLFSHLPYRNDTQMTEAKGPASDTVDKAISASKNLEEVHKIISEAMAKKIAALVAIDYEDIHLELPMTSFGLDSLVAIEFKNWIGRNLMASMQTSEIMDTTSIFALASLVATRSTLVTSDQGGEEHTNGVTSNGSNDVQSSSVQASNGVNGHTPAPRSLPRLPLPDLESTLWHYQESVRGISSPEELKHTEQVIEEFLKPEGIGNRLQERLADLAHNPRVPN